MREGERTFRWWVGFVAASCVALFLTERAYREALPPVLLAGDKLVHFTVGGLLAFFLDGAVRRRSFVLRGRAFSTSSALLLVVFGIEEFVQRFSVHRTPSFADYAADVAGVVFFTWLSRRIGRAGSEPGRTKSADDVSE